MISLLRDRLLQLLDRILRVLERVAVHLDIARILCLHLALDDLRVDRCGYRAFICGDCRSRIHSAPGLTDVQDILDRIAALAGDRDHDLAGSVRIQRGARYGIHGRSRVRRMRVELKRLCPLRHLHRILPDVITELRTHGSAGRLDPEISKRVVI